MDKAPRFHIHAPDHSAAIRNAQAEIKRLQDQLLNYEAEIAILRQQIRGAMDDPCLHCDEMTKQRDHYRAECKRLRAENDRLSQRASLWEGKVDDDLREFIENYETYKARIARLEAALAAWHKLDTEQHLAEEWNEQLALARRLTAEARGAKPDPAPSG